MSAQPQGRAPFPHFRPFARSRKARTDAMVPVRAAVADYLKAVKAAAQAENTVDLGPVREARRDALGALLDARAAVERALWLETSGRMGEEHATRYTTIRTLAVRPASVTTEND